MGIREKIIKDTEFLSELLVDSGMINGRISECETDLGKKAIEIYNQFEEDPRKISFGDVQDLTLFKKSQIGSPSDYLAHVVNTGGILRSLVLSLEKINQGLDLPHPDEAFAIGLIHDLNATFSDYSKGGQQSKEFDEYLLAKRCGWENVASRVAMHSDYLGGIRLMTEDIDFPMKESYKDMIKMLRGEGPLSYKLIFEEFQGYIEGKDRLHLMLLTISDYIENGKPFFDLDTFDKDFETRSQDVIWRYYRKALFRGETPSLLGQALVNGGVERMILYKNILSKLIKNDSEDVERFKLETNFYRG